MAVEGATAREALPGRRGRACRRGDGGDAIDGSAGTRGRAGDPDEMAAVLAHANAAGLRVAPRGAGPGSVGATPQPAWISSCRHDAWTG